MPHGSPEILEDITGSTGLESIQATFQRDDVFLDCRIVRIVPIIQLPKRGEIPAIGIPALRQCECPIKRNVNDTGVRNRQKNREPDQSNRILSRAPARSFRLIRVRFRVDARAPYRALCFFRFCGIRRRIGVEIKNRFQFHVEGTGDSDQSGQRRPVRPPLDQADEFSRIVRLFCKRFLGNFPVAPQ